MKNPAFVKENFIKNLYSPEIPETGSFLTGIFCNHREYLKEISEALNSDKYKLISLSGFQGTGKTSFINIILDALEENILNFYYECSSITHFDDIILSLFNFLKKIAIKNPEYKRNFKISNSQSIDERLINFIKSINIPLLIVIDGFENYSDGQEELFRFIEFLTSVSQIKIIIVGKTGFKDELYNGNPETVLKYKLTALDKEKSAELLKTYGIIETESCYDRIFQITRGYLENLLLFANAVKLLKITGYKLLEIFYEKEQNSFEEFIYLKTIQGIASEYKNVVLLFSAIRHAVSAETLKKLDFDENIEEKIEFLQKNMILTCNNDTFYIKNNFKDTIYSAFSAEEKQFIHKYFYELYSEQIGKKLEERIFSVSRKLLYSEQFYHYTSLLNLGEKSVSEIKTTDFSPLKPDLKYMHVNITDTLFVNKNSDISQENFSTRENNDFEINIQIDDFSEAKIKLSPEEQALLAQNEENVSQEEFKTSAKVNLVQNQSSMIEKKAETLEQEAEGLFKEGKCDFAAKKLEEAIVLYEIIRNIDKIEALTLKTGNIYKEGFRHDDALRYYYRILNAEISAQKPVSLVEAFCGAGDIFDYREEYSNALKYYSQAQSTAEKSQNKSLMAKVYFKKALAYDDLEDYGKALEFYQKNTEISQNIEENPNIAAAFANMAAIYEEKNDLENSKINYYNSLNFDKQLNNLEGQYETLSDIGNICFEQSDTKNAGDYFHQALAIAKNLNDDYKIAMSCLDIGDIYFADKNYEKALKAYIFSGKTIEKTISTDSKEKIDRRFKRIIGEIGESNYRQIIEKFKKKHG